MKQKAGDNLACNMTVTSPKIQVLHIRYGIKTLNLLCLLKDHKYVLIERQDEVGLGREERTIKGLKNIKDSFLSLDIIFEMENNNIISK